MNLQLSHALGFDAEASVSPNYSHEQSNLHRRERPSEADDVASNQLLFTQLEREQIGDIIDIFKSQGRRSAVICVDRSSTDAAALLTAEFARQGLPAPTTTDCSDVAAVAQSRDGVFFAIDDAARLSKSLTRLGALSSGFVCAPKTAHYFKSRPVFVQSVPKSGTHIVFECLRAFGYADPPSLDMPNFVAPLADGVFYNLQHMPISCLSPPFQRFSDFIQSLSRSVTVFIIRDPRDVAVSLAYYLASQVDYHITTSLFHDMSVSERVDRVIDGDYPIPIYINRYLNLNGGIEELLEPYLSWWSETFPNVWRVRYEDIIGVDGGGDAGRQMQTIWELQLALHVPGCPGDYCHRVFSRKALTFRRGQIGDYLIDFSQDHHELFQRTAGYLLATLGYADRWKILRPFCVRLPSTHDLSQSVTAQLRSELASRGRDFSSIAIDASGEGTIELKADRIGGTIVNDRCCVSVELTDGVRVALPGLGNFNEQQYKLRIRATLSPRHLVEAIIDALVSVGCVDRLTEGSFRRDPNSSFKGEIRIVVPRAADSCPLKPFVGENEDLTWPYFRSVIRRWRRSRKPGGYSSAQLD